MFINTMSPLIARNLYPEATFAIGFFDGIHQGHQVVINQAIKKSKKLKIKSSAITFVPHPKEILNCGLYT